MLKGDLNKDLIAALKGKDEGKVGTLRLVLSALQKQKIEKNLLQQ